MFIVPLTHPSLRFARSWAAGDSPRSPALDVAETDTGYEVVLDMPGVAKQDVKVSIELKNPLDDALAVAVPSGDPLSFGRAGTPTTGHTVAVICVFAAHEEMFQSCTPVRSYGVADVRTCATRRVVGSGIAPGSG